MGFYILCSTIMLIFFHWISFLYGNHPHYLGALNFIVNLISIFDNISLYVMTPLNFITYKCFIVFIL
jgi:hypothetical protein